MKCLTGGEVSFRNSPFSGLFRVPKVAAEEYIGLDETARVAVLAGVVHLDDVPAAIFLYVPCSFFEGSSGLMVEDDRRTIAHFQENLVAPILVMDSLADRLCQLQAPDLGDEGRIAAMALRENGRLIEEMVDGLRVLAESRELENSPEKFSSRELVAALIEEFRRQYAGTEFDVEIDDSMPDLDAPRQKVAAIFRCLLDNAFKYASGAGRATIMVLYQREPEFHRFAVADSGLGISEVYRQRVFEPLVRLPHESLKCLPGAGMGLTVARELVRSLNGEIGIDGSPAGGTMVVFTLPLSATD